MNGPANPDPTRHPRWCDRNGCTARGEHRSAPRGADTNRPEAAIVELALTQSLHPAAQPMVSLTGIGGGAAVTLTLSVGQATAARYKLAVLIDEARTDNRHRWS
ncbi:hypothetical protein [Micromonospora aurantiaca (nom. illeg.)]|uniref:hypothetical protein n=1 Tax=Micromonospora aurantiaca (nom. illeg.) TaxID=47850 RepID=UPI003F4A01EA